MADFDPDAYLASKASAPPAAPAFDPDAYISKKAPEDGILSKLGDAAMKGAKFGPIGMAGSMGMAGASMLNDAVEKGAYNAGGRVTDALANAGAPAPVAAGGGFATNVALQAIPALVGMGIGGAAAPVMEGGAARLMQSALKPGIKDLKNGNAATAIQTLLDNGINATVGGVAKLKEKIGGLNDEIASAILNSPATIDKYSAWNNIQRTLKKFTNQVNPGADMHRINSAWDQFISHPLLSGSDQIPVQLAQDLKQGTYRVLRDKYGQLGSADTEAQKAIAMGLKEGIANAVPEVAGLNAEESKLIRTLNVTERRVLMDANKNPMGLALLAQSPATWAAFMADRSPMFKSIAARMLNAGSEAVPEAAGGAAGADYSMIKNK